MTAPDRLVVHIRPGCSMSAHDADKIPEGRLKHDVEYVRKGAFPVEEIQELVNYPERMIDYGSWTTSMQSCLERILSLLESDDE